MIGTDRHGLALGQRALRFIRLTAYLALSPLLCSCASHHLYGTGVKQVSDKHYSLAVVEFTDQGAFYDREQYDRTLAHVTRTAEPRSVLVFVFAHGWNDSANPESPYFQNFECLLAEVAKLEHAANGRRREVIGLYLGWRGMSAYQPFSFVTIFGRKDAAETVGANGAAEMLLQVEHRVRKADASSPTKREPSQIVTVGHSLGASLIYSATSQILTERLIARSGNEALATPFGDVIVLINPAFEASRLRTLHELTEESTFDARQRPMLLLVTSESDPAVRGLWQFSRFFSKMFEDTPSGPGQDASKVLSREAVGVYEPYQTHKIILTGAPCARDFSASANPDRAPRPIPLSAATLCPTREAPTYSPVLVSSAPDELVKKHDGIWEPDFHRFLLDFLQWSLGLGS